MRVKDYVAAVLTALMFIGAFGLWTHYGELYSFGKFWFSAGIFVGSVIGLCQLAET